MKTETVTISKFKATCLGLLKQVKKKGEPILVTLKGEPVAMVVPPPPAEKSRAWIGIGTPARLSAISSLRLPKRRSGRFSADETAAGHPHPAVIFPF